MTTALCAALIITSASLPGGEAYLAGGEAQRNARYAEAIRAYERAAEESAMLAPYARTRAAYCRAASGDRPGGLAELARVLVEYPRGPWVRMTQAQLAEFFLLEGEPAAAAPLLAEVIDVRAVPWWLSRYQWEAAAAKARAPEWMDEGYGFFREVVLNSDNRNHRRDAALQLAESPRIEDLLYGAFGLSRLSEYDRTLPLIAKLGSAAAEGRLDEPVWLYVEGRQHVAKGDRTRGEQLLATLVRQHPDSEFTRHAAAYLAERFEVDGDRAAALAAYDRMVVQYPGTKEAGDSLWWFAQRLDGQGAARQALARYVQLAEHFPEHRRAPDALLGAAKLEGRIGASNAALEHYKALVERYPDSRLAAAALYESVGLLEADGKHAEARAKLRETAQARLGDYYSHRALARLLAENDPEARSGRTLHIGTRTPFVLPHPQVDGLAEPWPASWENEQWVRRLRFFARYGCEEAEWEALYAMEHAGEGELAAVLLLAAEAGCAYSADLYGRATLGAGEVSRAARLRLEFPRAYWPEVQAIAAETRLDPYLLLAIAKQESTFRPRIASHAGAVGVMQVMPATARWMAEVDPAISREHIQDLGNPLNSLRLGAYYLRRMLDRSGGNFVYALASYNAGPGNFDRWRNRGLGGGDLGKFVEEIPFGETRDYVKKVLGNYSAYHSIYPPEP